jgi:hypothetical protein
LSKRKTLLSILFKDSCFSFFHPATATERWLWLAIFEWFPIACDSPLTFTPHARFHVALAAFETLLTTVVAPHTHIQTAAPIANQTIKAVGAMMNLIVGAVVESATGALTRVAATIL